jgi:hypothetical protein
MGINAIQMYRNQKIYSRENLEIKNLNFIANPSNFVYPYLVLGTLYLVQFNFPL